MTRFFHQNNNVIFRSVGFANPTLRKIVQQSDNLIVLNDGILAIKPEKIYDVKVQMTIFEGKIIYTQENEH